MSSVDLRLRRDVDAAGRLVEQQHVDVVVQEARDRHLLLVAARQLADRLLRPLAADAELADPLLGQRAALRRAHDHRHLRQRQVVGDAEAEREPLLLAVLADQRHALRPALTGRGGPGGGAQLHLAGYDRVQAGQRAQQLGTARADQARDAQHLAAVKREAGAFGLAGDTGQVRYFQERLAGRVGEGELCLPEPVAGGLGTLSGSP